MRTFSRSQDAEIRLHHRFIQSLIFTQTHFEDNIMTRSCSIPYYIQLQAIGSSFNHKEDTFNKKLMPETIRWRKLNQLITAAYLGKYPSYFLDGNPQNEEYLSKVLELIYSSKTKEIDTMEGMDSVSKSNNVDLDTSYGGYYLDEIPTNRKKDEISSDNSIFDLRMPKGWNLEGINQLDLSDDSLTIKTGLIENNFFNIYPRSSNKGGIVTVPLDYLPSLLLGIFYFEVTITEGAGNEIDLAIGFIKEDKRKLTDIKIKNIDLRVPDDRVVSWYGKSGLFTAWNRKREDKTFCSFGKGDTIGLGFNQIKDEFFITKNGNYLDSHGSVDSFLNKGFEGNNNSKGLLPCVCFGSWTGARLNLGDDSKNLFKFDIEYYVKRNKKEVMNDIETSKFIENPKSEINFIDSIVMGYLKHNGFARTAKGFEKDILDLRNEDVSEVRKKNFELCEFKEKIRELIQQNQYDEVIDLININYPTLFKENYKILFRLEVVRLLQSLDHGEYTIKQLLQHASKLKELFNDQESHDYVDQISIVFSYAEVRECPLFSDFFDLEKAKIIYAIHIALNKINHLALVSPLDNLILQVDEKLASMMHNLGEDKSVLLINLLEDYVKQR